MNEERLRLLLARIMVWGVIASAGLMIVGGAIFLSHNAWKVSGDHKFTGEPADLRHPVAIVEQALRGNDDCLIQVGVLLLLFNPLVRVAMAAIGYAAGGDRLYTAIAAFVLAVLVGSYFL